MTTPRYKSVPPIRADRDRLIRRMNEITARYPDSLTRRRILARYEDELRDLAQDALDSLDSAGAKEDTHDFI